MEIKKETALNESQTLEIEVEKVAEQELNLDILTDEENSKQKEITSETKLRLPITRTFILALNQIKMICTIGVPMTV